MLNSNNPSRRTSHAVAASSQHGIVLLVALIVLVAMTLAGIGLMRSMNTSNRVAGNLAFQQAATLSADVGIETAIAWLEAHAGAALYNDSTGTGLDKGYFAAKADPTAGQSWEAYWATLPAANIFKLALDPAPGNKVSYVIHRLCDAGGDPATGIGCAVVPGTVGSEGNSKGANVLPLNLSGQQYYRITARVAGPRNTVGFVQAVVAM